MFTIKIKFKTREVKTKQELNFCFIRADSHIYELEYAESIDRFYVHKVPETFHDRHKHSWYTSQKGLRNSFSFSPATILLNPPWTFHKNLLEAILNLNPLQINYDQCLKST